MSQYRDVEISNFELSVGEWSRAGGGLLSACAGRR